MRGWLYEIDVVREDFRHLFLNHKVYNKNSPGHARLRRAEAQGRTLSMFNAWVESVYGRDGKWAKASKKFMRCDHGSDMKLVFQEVKAASFLRLCTTT